LWVQVTVLQVAILGLNQKYIKRKKTNEGEVHGKRSCVSRFSFEFPLGRSALSVGAEQPVAAARA